MCVVSMVYDHYQDKIDGWNGIQAKTIVGSPLNVVSTYSIISQEEIDALRLLIKEFREAVVAAKIVDKLTNQPDCEDPEKKKLENRVAELEERLSALELA